MSVSCCGVGWTVGCACVWTASSACSFRLGARVSHMSSGSRAGESLVVSAVLKRETLRTVGWSLRRSHGGRSTVTLKVASLSSRRYEPPEPSSLSIGRKSGSEGLLWKRAPICSRVSVPLPIEWQVTHVRPLPPNVSDLKSFSPRFTLASKPERADVTDAEADASLSASAEQPASAPVSITATRQIELVTKERLRTEPPGLSTWNLCKGWAQLNYPRSTGHFVRRERDVNSLCGRTVHNRGHAGHSHAITRPQNARGAPRRAGGGAVCSPSVRLQSPNQLPSTAARSRSRCESWSFPPFSGSFMNLDSFPRP